MQPRLLSMFGAALLTILSAIGCRSECRGSGCVPDASVNPPVANGSVTVASGTSVGTLKTDWGTNTFEPAVMSMGGPQVLQAMQQAHLPFVRIHAGAAYVNTAPYGADPYNNLLPNPGQIMAPDPCQPGIDCTSAWDMSALDGVVADTLTAGAQILLNIKHPPAWMFTCTSNPGYPNGPQFYGTFGSSNYAAFGDYIARVVSWYNRGYLVDENGITHANPSFNTSRNRPITYWELFNEPDGNWETPCIKNPWGPTLSDVEYVNMWNVVVPKMKAAQGNFPIKVIGPAISSPGSAQSGMDYVTQLRSNAVPGAEPDAISYHQYGDWQNGDPDAFFLVGDNGMNGWGVEDFDRGLDLVKSKSGTLPVWLTEYNMNAAWYEDTVHRREWSELSAAWTADTFLHLAVGSQAGSCTSGRCVLGDGSRGIDMIFHYDVIASGRSFQWFDDGSYNNGIAWGTPRFQFYRDQLLRQYFAPGSLVRPVTIGGLPASDLEAVAVSPPGRAGQVNLLVINKRIANSTDVGGIGIPICLSVALDSTLPASHLSIVKLDRSLFGQTQGLNPDTYKELIAIPAPSTVCSAPPCNDGGTVVLPGYGVWIFSWDAQTMDGGLGVDAGGGGRGPSGMPSRGCSASGFPPTFLGAMAALALFASSRRPGRAACPWRRGS